MMMIMYRGSKSVRHKDVNIQRRDVAARLDLRGNETSDKTVVPLKALLAQVGSSSVPDTLTHFFIMLARDERYVTFARTAECIYGQCASRQPEAIHTA